MKSAASIVVFAAALAAQQRMTVHLSTPEAVVVSARTVQVSATLRNTANAIVPASFTWSSNNTAVASVDANGVVTAQRPGIANITANAQGTTGSLQIQVVPLRIEVSPTQKIVRVGESLQYTAQAIDADGQPIEGVTFSWATIGANGGQINAARIDNSGMMLTNAIAKVTVRASINYTSPGVQFAGQFVGTARLEIRPADSYRLTRLLASDEAPRRVRLRPSATTIATAENGVTAFMSSLDGYANGIVLVEGGTFTVLGSTGMPKPLYGGTFSDFGGLSVNSQGQVLTNASGPNVQNLPGIGGLLLLSREGSRMLFINGADSINIAGPPVQRYSLNDSGDVVFHASYAGTPTLFRISGGTINAVWSVTSPLQGMASPYQFEDWGIDNAGDVVFRARSGSQVALYRVTQSATPVRLIGIGDTIGGSRVSGLYWMALAQSGDVAVAFDVEGSFDRRFTRMAKGDTVAQYQVLTYNGASNVRGVGPAGVLFEGPQGLLRWQGNTVTTALATSRPTFNGEPATSVYDAGMSAAGMVFAVLLTPSGYVVVRDGTVIADTSTVVEGPGYYSISGFVAGARQGPAHLIMDNSNRSVFELDGFGMVPRILAGDRIGDENTNPRLTSVRKTLAGEMYVNWSSDRIYRLTADGAMVQFRPPACDIAGCINFSGFGGANPDGTVLWYGNGNNGNNRMYVTRNGQHTVLLSVTGNTTFVGPPGVTVRNYSGALDGQGRVMSWINAEPASASGLYVYQDGAWQRLVALNGRLLDLPEVSSAGVLESLDDGFLVNLFSRYDGTVLAHWNGGWQSLMIRNEPAAVGGQINGVQRARANSRGAAALGLSWNGNSGVNVRMPDGALRSVLAIGDMLPEGGYVADVIDLDFRDDGRIYILLRDFDDRMLVYLAEPL